MKTFLLLLLLALPLCAAPTTNAPSVTLAWNASVGTNIAAYTVYYGVATRAYTNTVNAGTNLTCSVSNLVRNTTYYFAATAKDSNGLESIYSTEVSWFVAPLPNSPGGLTITPLQP